MRNPNFNIDELIQYIQGTCIDLNRAIGDLWQGMEDMDLTDEELSQIDNEIFFCEECGWCCEISEMSEYEDEVCKDCCAKSFD